MPSTVVEPAAICVLPLIEGLLVDMTNRSRDRVTNASWIDRATRLKLWAVACNRSNSSSDLH